MSCRAGKPRASSCEGRRYAGHGGRHDRRLDACRTCRACVALRDVRDPLSGVRKQLSCARFAVVGRRLPSRGWRFDVATRLEPRGRLDATRGCGGRCRRRCAPLGVCAVDPQRAWTSPYAAWSRGIPTDPSFFPIGVWLQGSWHATELAGLGINIYVGNNAGTDSLAASDLGHAEGPGHVRDRRAGQRRARQHRRHDHRRLVDGPRRAGQRAGRRDGRIRTAGQPVDARHSIQFVQGGRPDPTHLSRPRAGRRVPTLRGTRQQSAAPNRGTCRPATSSRSTSTRTTTARATRTTR